MEIKNKGKSNQVVWGIWEDAYKSFVPRELKIIETDSRLGNGDKVYHLICKTNKVNVYTTGSKLFSTQAEAQAECDRKNKSNYTHLLKCRHCVSEGHCRTYYMRCNVIGETKKSIKLEIIGERYWKGYENKRRIRYLPKEEMWRLQKNKGE